MTAKPLPPARPPLGSSGPKFAFACPNCDSTLEVDEGRVGGTTRCPECEQTVPVTARRKPADPFAERLLAAVRIGSVCQACFQPAPTRRAGFLQHIGAVVVFFHKEVKGEMCRKCINRYFTQFTFVTAAFGWWGMVSLVCTPVVLIHNVVRYLLCLGLEPGPGQEEEKGNLLPYAAVLAALTPFALVALLVFLAR